MTTERRRTTQTLVGAGPGPSDPFTGDADARGTATVAHGPYAEALPVAGLTVGAVRERFADRLDIHPEAQALIDGEPVDDEAAVRADALLMFVQRAGEKGAEELSLFDLLPKAARKAKRERDPAAPAPGGGGEPAVTVVGAEVRVTTAEGATAARALDDVLAELADPWPGLADAVLPDGVKLVRPSAGRLVLVHQTPPRIWRFRWIAADSPARHGPGTSYREVRLALPYLVVLARLERCGPGLAGLGRWNEAFFAHAPLDREGLATPLCFPALLNCSKLPDDEARPLSWICTQHLAPPELPAEPTLAWSLADALRRLLHHLLETGFNYSSEEHEGASWFSETAKAAVDPRVADVEAWERATAEDGLFALDVPWLPTGHTLGGAIERACRAVDVDGPGRPRARTRPRSAADVARVVLRPARRRRRGRPRKEGV